MVEAYADRPVWSVTPGATSPTGDAPAARRSGQLRLLPTPDAATRPAEWDPDASDAFERAGLRVGRAIGRLGRRLRASAETPPPAAVLVATPEPIAETGSNRQSVAPAPANRIDLRGAAGPAPSTSSGVHWRQVKQALEVVDGVPALRAVADRLLGPWGLDLLVVGAVAVGLLYPANPLGITAGHADLLNLAVPLLKAALGVVLSPLAVEVALALLGIGRLLWSRRSPSPRAALGV